MTKRIYLPGSNCSTTYTQKESSTRAHTHTHRPPRPPPPETHRDRSLIHIFLLGADFSSRGDGQSDSSISGGLRGDSSMLSHCLENRRRRQPLCSASDPYREILAPHPRPFPPAAGVDQPGRCVSARPKLAGLQFLRLLLSRYPAELWAPASSSPRRCRRHRRRRYLRHRRRALPQPPPRLPPPPPARAPSLRSPPCSSTRPPAGLPRSVATPPPRLGAQESLGVHTLRSAQGRARSQAPSTSGCCVCPCARGGGERGSAC